MGWAELGDLDHYGHNQGWKLAWRVDEVVREFVDRLTALLEAGWKQVRVVTDHGWLLLPGGLPKSELPSFLAETRWGRCAVLKDTSVVDTAVVPWYWSPHVRVAMAPGIHVFRNGVEYAHGGLSVQECVAARTDGHTAGGQWAACHHCCCEMVRAALQGAGRRDCAGLARGHPHQGR